MIKWFYKHPDESDWSLKESSGNNSVTEVAAEIAESRWVDEPSDPREFEMTFDMKLGERGRPMRVHVHAEEHVSFHGVLIR